MRFRVKSDYISKLCSVIIFVSFTGCLPEMPAPNSKSSIVVSLVCDLTDGCNAGKAPTITFSPPAGTYGAADNVTDITISTPISGAKICYTINNTNPSCDTTSTCTTGFDYTAAVAVPANTQTIIKAVACSSDSIYSATYNIDINAPGYPSDFVAIADDTKVHLSWTNVADPDLAGITILRCADPCFPSNVNDPVAYRVDLGVVTSYSDVGLTNNTKYNYFIYSKDIAGNYSNAYSDDATPNSGLLYIFVTNTLYDGNLGGVAGADARCNSDSAKPIPTATYKALLVDGATRIACTSGGCSTGSTEHTDWVLKPNQSYYNVAGDVIAATDVNGLFPNNLTNSIKPLSSNYSWTGLFIDWTTHSSHCNGWTDNTNSSYGAAGKHDKTINNGSFNDSAIQCDSTVPLYCVQQ